MFLFGLLNQVLIRFGQPNLCCCCGRIQTDH
eukprot:SAG11_NODE_16241_length_553_cov_1.160793_1_plen_30_part_01